MNHWAAKHLAYLPVRRFQGADVCRYLRELEANQYLDATELETVRDQKIRSLVVHAYRRVPFYRQWFDDAGIAPESIRGYQDLPQIPVLSKRTILEREGDLLALPWEGRTFQRTTSGSTGMTLHFRKETEALARNDAVMFRCYGWYGVEIGSRQVRFWGVPVARSLRIRERLKDFVANRIRVSAFELSASKCAAEHKRITRFGPDYLYGYTSAIYGFAVICADLGLPLARWPLKAVICTAEKMYPTIVRCLRRRFPAPWSMSTGSSENGVIAFQCRLGAMHMMSDHLAVEFVDDAGKPRAPGERGRVVVTDLSSYAMPLIRYDIGDIGAASEARCTCGVTLPLMEIVEGRKEDFIRTESGTLVHAAYLCYTLKDDAVREFKMYQRRRDAFLVQIVKSPTFGQESEEVLKARLRTALGRRIEIDFEYLTSIPREASGKLRYFVSEIDDGRQTADRDGRPGSAASS